MTRGCKHWHGLALCFQSVKHPEHATGEISLSGDMMHRVSSAMTQKGLVGWDGEHNPSCIWVSHSSSSSSSSKLAIAQSGPSAKAVQ